MTTDFLDTIKLSEMDRVKLMNRTDEKFWFHSRYIYDILLSIKHDYYILDINGEKKLPYKTTYYDTYENDLYTSHHNGKLNRVKIRKRQYVNSGISYLEVKHKNNKGRTIKKRIESNFETIKFSDGDSKFISSLTQMNSTGLTPSLNNSFYRITLVNKNFRERCTIDFDLTFKSDSKQVCFNDLIVLEIKSEGHSSGSTLKNALKKKRIRSSGFSKYCIGRMVSDNSIKHNAFKEKLRILRKNFKIDLNFNNICNQNLQPATCNF